MENMILNMKHIKKRYDDNYIVSKVISTTKSQQLVHVTIPNSKMHREEALEYTSSLIIVHSGKGVIIIGNESKFINKGDIITIHENSRVRIWATNQDLSLLFIYSSQIFPDLSRRSTTNFEIFDMNSENTEEKTSCVCLN